MTVLTQRAPAGHYRFRHVARMEWIKLRTLRSTWWTLAITAAGGAAMAVVIGLNTISKSADLTNNVLAGVVPGLLLIGVLGVLVMTSEYTSGMIRATLAAAPRRPLLLDEPVNGLDPAGIHWIRDLLGSLAGQGRVVLVSSHLISEIALLAEHLVVIGQGRLLADTSVAGLSAGAASLEEAFLELTGASTHYGRYPSGITQRKESSS